MQNVSSPPVATLSMGTPAWCDMKPSTENTTRPAKKLVKLFITGTTMASLRTAEQNRIILLAAAKGWWRGFRRCIVSHVSIKGTVTPKKSIAVKKYISLFIRVANTLMIFLGRKRIFVSEKFRFNPRPGRGAGGRFCPPLKFFQRYQKTNGSIFTRSSVPDQKWFAHLLKKEN